MTRRRARSWAHTALVMLLAAAGGAGCAGKKNDKVDLTPGGQNTYEQARRYVDKAVRGSTEGVILMPSRKAETLYDRTRLNDIAQRLRVPAAVCFVNRAIATMKRSVKDGELTFIDIPEGQIRIRTRINSSGEVVRTEVLETGFQDEQMYPCLDEAIKKVKWTENRSGTIQFIDIIYWVSLGYQAEDHSDQAKAELRLQAAKASVKAKGCLTGRVGEGIYRIDGLSLVDRDGRTLANRVEPGVVPDKVGECLAIMLRDMRMPRVKEAFVRPILPHVEFVVSREGEVTFVDEPWLALMQREEDALRDARLADIDDPETEVDESQIPSGSSAPTNGPRNRGPLATATDGPEPTMPSPSQLPSSSPPPPAGPAGLDPASGGLKLKLGGLRGTGSRDQRSSNAVR